MITEQRQRHACARFGGVVVHIPEEVKACSSPRSSTPEWYTPRPMASRSATVARPLSRVKSSARDTMYTHDQQQRSSLTESRRARSLHILRMTSSPAPARRRERAPEGGGGGGGTILTPIWGETASFTEPALMMGAHLRLPLAILTVACGANVINVDPTAPTVREAKHTLAKLSSDVDVIRSSVDELQLSHARRQKLEALSEALASARDAADDYLDVGRPSTPLVLSHAFCHALYESSRCLLEVVGLRALLALTPVAQSTDLRPPAGAVLLAVFSILFCCRSVALWICSHFVRRPIATAGGFWNFQCQWLGRAFLDLCGILGVLAELLAPERPPDDAKRR